MRLLLLSVCCLLPSLFFAQVHTRYFPLPGPLSYNFWGYNAPIVETPDGGYLLNYGYGAPNIHAGTGDGVLIKTDSTFLPQWRLGLHGESGRAALSYPDGSTIVVSNSVEIGIQKVGLGGQNIWNRRIYRGPVNSQVITNLLTTNGNIELIGYLVGFDGFGLYSYTAPMILEMDTAGNFVGMDSLDLTGLTFPNVEASMHDAAGNLILAGKVHGGTTIEFLMKLDANHAPVWGSRFMTNQGLPTFEVIREMGNGDLLLGGSLNNSANGYFTMVIARVSAAGSLVWVETTNDIGKVTDFLERPNGNILVMGKHQAMAGDTTKAMILEIDGGGAVQWAKTYAPAIAVGAPYLKSANEWVFPVVGEYFPMLLQTDSLGNSGCASSNVSTVFYPLSMPFNAQSCTVHSVSMSFSPLVTDTVVSQTYVDSCASPLGVGAIVADAEEIVVFPNPARDHIVVRSQSLIESIEVVDALGEVVLRVHPSANEQEVVLANSGVYFVSVTTAKGIVTKRVAVMR